MRSLGNYLPSIYLQSDADGSLADFVDAYDTVHESLVTAIETLATCNQPRRAPLSFQGYIAEHYGNPFPFMTNERWAQGAKAENLTTIYGMRGTAPGAVAVVRYLTGAPMEIIQDFQYCWKLGVSLLGVGIDMDNPTSNAGTVLLDPDFPNFIANVPATRVGSPKPAANTAIKSWMLPVISHFWPMWEAAGTVVDDIIDSDFNGAITVSGASTITWDGAGKNGECLTAAGLVDGTDVIIPALILSGEFSIDFLANSGTGWQHVVITNDSVNGMVKYINGVQSTVGAFQANLTITQLFAFADVVNGSLEYFRTWNRVLNLVEIQSLAADPYCMFGVTQQTLAEIITILEFMLPYREIWDYINIIT